MEVVTVKSYNQKNIQEVNLLRFDVNTEDEGRPYHEKSQSSKPVTAKRFQEQVRVHIYLAIIQTGNHSNQMFRFQPSEFLSSRWYDHDRSRYSLSLLLSDCSIPKRWIKVFSSDGPKVETEFNTKTEWYIFNGKVQGSFLLSPIFISSRWLLPTVF